MVELSIQVSDDLAARLRPLQDHLEEILELGLREFEPTLSPIYDEVVDFLAIGPSTSEIASFRASKKAQERMSELLDKNRLGQLTELEAAELNRFQTTNHFMTLVKARARRLLTRSS